MKQVSALLACLAAIPIIGFAQVKPELLDDLVQIDTTIKQLSYRNFQLLEGPLPFDLTTDDKVARIRADPWENIDIGTLPEYRMPTYEPSVTTSMPMVEIDSMTYYTLEIQDFGAGKKESQLKPKVEK